jgi:hypothetical protein
MVSPPKENETMHKTRTAAFAVVALWACASARTAEATTLQRAGIRELTAANATVVVGEVVDARSYWNAEHTFVLTDVRVAPTDVLKGAHAGGDLTVTLMGGTVGDRSVLIVGGARLEVGRSYVLFLNEEDLPGAPRVRTVRDHCQGVFDLVAGGDGLTRAVSQASTHGLAPDAAGQRQAPGGSAGLPLTDLVEQVQAARGGAR